ncbi:ATP binding protein [Gracilaria domingensis]|nr:ATP binding protein [Gracilaria domingensis]
MVRNASSGTIGLLWLPDDILLRVLRVLMGDDGTQKRDNLRDLWNVATTCSKLYTLALRMLQRLRTTRLELNDGVPHNVVATMPDDVIQGAMLTLRGSKRGAACRAMRVVRLNAMERGQLQAALNRLRKCFALRVLCFVDVEGGVTLPGELARRVKVLSITSPSPHTLKALRDARCAPRMLRLCCVDDASAFELHDVWEALTRESRTMDVTWSGGLVPRYEYDGIWYLPRAVGPAIRVKLSQNGRAWRARGAGWMEDGSDERVAEQQKVALDTGVAATARHDGGGRAADDTGVCARGGGRVSRRGKATGVGRRRAGERAWARRSGERPRAAACGAAAGDRAAVLLHGKGGVAGGGAAGRKGGGGGQRARTGREHAGVHGARGRRAARDGGRRAARRLDAAYAAAREWGRLAHGGAAGAGAGSMSTRGGGGSVRRGRARRYRAVDAREAMRACLSLRRIAMTVVVAQKAIAAKFVKVNLVSTQTSPSPSHQSSQRSLCGPRRIRHELGEQ